MEEARKKLFLDWLRGIGVTEIKVSFDGGGDSGQIESIECTGITDNLLEAPAPVHIKNQFGHDADFHANTHSVRDLVEGICYEFLAYDVLGFDYINNDGGYGEIIIRPAENSILMEGHERFTSSRGHDYDLSLGKNEHVIGEFGGDY